ncbi:uncharacterized protein LOC142329346 isoform X2 [Lycorma delicatula]|uniref:uncharacterized protein LOC142329346 isoform X2 n=1 Tax=Lycorma delicatula TaxID=130591 RepID=UPI003F511E30
MAESKGFLIAKSVQKHAGRTKQKSGSVGSSGGTATQVVVPAVVRVSGATERHASVRRVRFQLPPTQFNGTSSNNTRGIRTGYNADNTDRLPTPALLAAARDADDDALRDILRRGAVVGVPPAVLNASDSSGRTAVSYIASNGPLSILESIVQLPGLDINKPDNEGNTPLHFAAQAGQVECVNFLLSRCSGIEVDARNNLGFTPLMKAAIQGRTKCAKLLIFAGASPTMRDTGRGLRAEQWARFCGRYVCADVIEKLSRHRLLERTTSYGNWGSEPELGPHLVNGRLQPPLVSTINNSSSSSGIKSKLRRAFRTTSTPSSQSFSLVTQLTSAALCASSPALPSSNNVPPVIKSLIRPLSVPKLQVTNISDESPSTSSNSSIVRLEQIDNK